MLTTRERFDGSSSVECVYASDPFFKQQTGLSTVTPPAVTPVVKDVQPSAAEGSSPEKSKEKKRKRKSQAADVDTSITMAEDGAEETDKKRRKKEKKVKAEEEDEEARRERKRLKKDKKAAKMEES
jgi:H/ACA ribonucleoprotein complex subunit 4